MKKTTNNQEVTKSKALEIFEYALLIFYLGIIILRVLHTEGPTMQTSSITLIASDSVYSLYVSGAMLLSFLVWLTWNFCESKFSYRITGIEIGLLIFIAAALISGSAAADKRLAINNIVTLLTPIFCAILLVQILDSSTKVKLVLSVIAALGVVSAYQCADQLLFLNQETIKQYEQNPDIALQSLNIQKDTLQHFLFEQRLNSSNANAFFTTRNSAGSFFLMAIFVLFALRIVSENSSKLKIFFIILLFAILLTKSKGAVISFFFSFFMIGLYQKHTSIFHKYRKIILLSGVIVIIAATSVIAFYGTQNNTLPGGNSMLVRWQYWKASTQMFLDHFWTGVGPGNFSVFYPHYKPAAAIESVSDPHNFPLSISTQYGIVGLIGFLFMIFLPLWNTTKGVIEIESPKTRNENYKNITVTNVVLCIIFGIVLSKVALSEAFKSGNVMVIIYLLLRLCIPPFVVFCISLYFIRKYTLAELDNEQNVIRKNGFVVIILCAMLGVLLHNLTDFAIFEPGIYTTFWFILATLIAVNANNKNNKKKISFNILPMSLPKIIRPVSAVSFSLVIFLLYVNFALLPVVSSTEKIKLANESFAYGGLQQANELLDSAAQDDKLSSYALTLNARMFVHNAEISPSMAYEALRIAEDYYKQAIERNSESYKDYEDLSQIYVKLSEVSPSNESAGLLMLALNAAMKAKNRYEGNERLYYNIAQISDKLGQTDIALNSYEKTVEIEDQYRNQFKLMFPKAEVVSRLGEDKYQLAQKRISELASQNAI